MKKWLACMVALALLCAFALAEGVPGISNDLFSDAKEALSLLSYGEYQKVADLLGLGEAADWETFAGEFKTLDSGTVQREVSVAWWTGNAWLLAVPVSEPKSAGVEAIVFTSADGSAFSGYQRSDWGSVQSAYAGSSYVTWNEEYVAGTPVVIAD